MNWLAGNRRSVCGIPFCLGLVWLLATMAAGQARASEHVYQYGPDPAQMLTVCVPDEGRAPYPAVLMLHGGGWQSGSREGYAKVCAEFAARGIVAVPTDYRLNNDPPRTSWPMQFSDAQLAMRWLRGMFTSCGQQPTVNTTSL